jgi:hypothetical protein
VSKFPWKKLTSVYADAGPEHRVIFAIEGFVFIVAPVDMLGRDTGRRRYKVDCVECDCVLHEATTGPSSHIEGHMKEKHGLGDKEILYDS